MNIDRATAYAILLSGAAALKVKIQMRGMKINLQLIQHIRGKSPSGFAPGRIIAASEAPNLFYCKWLLIRPFFLYKQPLDVLYDFKTLYHYLISLFCLILKTSFRFIIARQIAPTDKAFSKFKFYDYTYTPCI